MNWYKNIEHTHCSHLQIRDDAAFVYVDASDENRSNWMRWALFLCCFFLLIIVFISVTHYTFLLYVSGM